MLSPPASSLPDGPDPEFDLVRAASPTVRRLLATVVTDPSFESTAASVFVAELVDYAATCRLNYAASHVAEYEQPWTQRWHPGSPQAPTSTRFPRLVFATADTEALALVKSELQKRHTFIDLSELRSYLGLQITRNTIRRTITMTLSHMVHQVLQRFGFWFSLPQSTPLPTGHLLSAPGSDESVEPSGLYPGLVSCLMYLMTCTRPDLAYPLSILARYVALGRHRLEHWEAAKRVLRYLCSTSGMGLMFGRRGPVVLTGHADASLVDDLATQRLS
ncbi:unnamed protein product [Closterium sp. NIES-54]